MIGQNLQENENVKANTLEINKLKEALPQYFNNKGEFELDKFKEFLNLEEVDISKEGYGLNFLGKSYAKYLSSLRTETFISPDIQHNSNIENENSENLYIVGDNIDALKHLLSSYSGKIKCIYIDPPYNTGSDGFVYPDNFQFNVDELSEKIGITEEEAQRILDLAGKSTHSAWLTFMYPRLMLARDLLSDDGVIFISIDDNELANLKLICDEIYGEENMLTRITWESKTKSQNTNEAKFRLQAKTESILVYKKRGDKYNFALQVRHQKQYNKLDENGKYRLAKVEQMSNTGIRGRDSMIFSILGVEPKTGNQWKIGKDTVKEFQDRGDLLLIDNEPYRKIRPDDEDSNNYAPFWSHFLSSEIYGTAEKGNSEVKEYFGVKDIFDTVKPVGLIKKIINHMQGEVNDKDFIVCDFFSGSSTTAESVMQLNSESKEKLNLKYILVQIYEKTQEKSVANRHGFNSIDEIGRSRIEKAAKKIKEETGANIDYGYKLYYLEKPKEKTLVELEEFEPEINFLTTDMISIFDNEHSSGKESILATWLNEDGYGLTVNSRPYLLDTYQADLIGKSIYLINEGLEEEDVMTLIKKIENEELDINRVVVYVYSATFSVLQELRKNLKVLRNNNVTLIERF